MHCSVFIRKLVHFFYLWTFYITYKVKFPLNQITSFSRVGLFVFYVWVYLGSHCVRSSVYLLLTRISGLRFVSWFPASRKIQPHAPTHQDLHCGDGGGRGRALEREKYLILINHQIEIKSSPVWTVATHSTLLLKYELIVWRVKSQSSPQPLVE